MSLKRSQCCSGWTLPSGTADGHFVELDGWHAYADGDALAVFTAGADAFVKRPQIDGGRTWDTGQP